MSNHLAQDTVAEPAVDEAVDWKQVRAQFPALGRRIHGKPLVYFDSANTAQKPQRVIDAVTEYYTLHNANISRAVHTLGSEATERFEATRSQLQKFIRSPRREDVVLTRGTTESINLVAYSWALPRLKAGDEILVSVMEHHANIVPWQLVAERTGARVRVVPITDRGEIDLDALRRLLGERARLLAVAHVSNALGTINPVREICALARARGVPVLVDGSQAAPHLPIDVARLGCDFYAFTGHKMFGPTGTGALWAKREWLDGMPPFMGGGDMIRTVSFEGTTFADPPQRFEAGTPNIAGIIGLGAAVDLLAELPWSEVIARESELLAHLGEVLRSVQGLRVLGDAADKVPVVSFVIDGIHAHDLATLLDTHGIAVRSGHHCAHPLMQRYGITASCRASLAFYNTHAEVERFRDALTASLSLLR
ncbi:MAG: cysteine desulfurase [Lysobacterales bacterium]